MVFTSRAHRVLGSGVLGLQQTSVNPRLPSSLVMVGLGVVLLRRVGLNSGARDGLVFSGNNALYF